jgi:myo-inositol-1(or 4)-monophosphatase
LAAIDTPSADLNLMMDAARQAGAIAMRYFKGSNEVWYKSGNSPVSEADKGVDNFLRETFETQRPDYAWLSEETEDNNERISAKRVVIVDPIDGTRGFIEGRTEWCISIAIVEQQKPIEAVLYCPALDELYAASKDAGTILPEKPITDRKDNRPRATGSKKLIEVLDGLADKPFDVTGFIPSLAYRLALVATGELDVAFARGGASEWDVAAADLILSESGCSLVNSDGHSILYNKLNVKLPAMAALQSDKAGIILPLAKSSGILQ